MNSEENLAVQGLTRLTVDIVSAYLAANPLPLEELPRLLRTVRTTLASVGEAGVAAAPKPAIPVRRTVTRDYIVCLEDGKRFRSLTRHLRAAFGMTPTEYRRKWGLPGDYPMVAPSYAARRSELAKKIGLGRKRKSPAGGRRPRPNPSQSARSAA